VPKLSVSALVGGTGFISATMMFELSCQGTAVEVTEKVLVYEDVYQGTSLLVP